MPAENIGSMQVEYAIETRQALSHLNDMGRYLEMVAAAAEYNAEAVDQMTDAVGRDLETATSKYKKYAAAASDYLKKVKHGWLIVGTAVVGMMYGLIRSSSYGSIYMKQFGAATRMLADKIMEDSGLNEVIQILLDNFMDFSSKVGREGWFDASVSEIIDFLTWIVDNFGLFVREGSPLDTFFTWFKNKFNTLIGNMSQWGKDIIDKLSTGIENGFPNLISTASDIYNKVAIAIEDLILDSWGWGANIVSNLVDGIKGAIPSLGPALDKITAKFEGMWTSIKSIISKIFSHWDALMIDISVGTALDKITAAFEVAGKLITKIFDGLLAVWNALPWTLDGGGDSHSDSYGDSHSDSYGDSYSDSYADSWDDYADSWHDGWNCVGPGGATGGHVARGGRATIHEGEDIVRLKQLLSGLKTDQAQPTSIVVSPTINIRVDHDTGKDAQKIARLISDEIGKEVRRIMPIR